MTAHPDRQAATQQAAVDEPTVRATERAPSVSAATLALAEACAQQVSGGAALATAEYELAVRSVPLLIVAAIGAAGLLLITWLLLLAGGFALGSHLGLAHGWLLGGALAVHVIACAVAIGWLRALGTNLTFPRLRHFIRRATGTPSWQG